MGVAAAEEDLECCGSCVAVAELAAEEDCAVERRLEDEDMMCECVRESD